MRMGQLISDSRPRNLQSLFHELLASVSAHRSAIFVAIGLTLSAEPVSSAEQTLSCTPHFKFLCSNIHVACAGRSRIPAPFLSVRVIDERAVVTTDSGQTFSGETSDQSANLILFDDKEGYLKIADDQTFSLRVYLSGRAYMSRGTCQ